MMRYLFHIKGDPSYGPLQSFPQDRIERFTDLWIARQQKDKGQHDIFDLFLYLGLLDCLVEKNWSIAKKPSEGFEDGEVIKELDWQRHTHDGFASHNVGGYLFDDQFENTLLEVEHFFVDEYKLFGVVEFPAGSQRKVVDSFPETIA